MIEEPRNLAGKVCLVTGATGGIGLITAQTLAAQGATVVLVSRSAAKCAEAVASITAQTGNANLSYLAGDLSSLTQVRAVASEFLAHHARLDVLINNAGAVFATAPGQRRRL